MILGEYCDAYPPELDGVGMVVRSYVQELNQLGDSCYYVAPDAPDYAAQADLKTLLYRGVKLPGEPYHFGLPTLNLPFRRQQHEIHFDLVHAHSPFTAGVEALRLSISRGIPLVGTFHSKYYDDFYQKTHSRLISQFGTRGIVLFYELCDEVWAVNAATAQVLHDYGFKGDIQVMPNGTNLWYPEEKDCLRAAEAFSVPRDKPVFLFVGQQNWKKNILLTLEALQMLREKLDFTMIMVGQGPDAEAIRQKADEFGLTSRMRFTGHIMDRELMMGIYALADLLIFPSVYDNAPMVVREAAASGTASVLVRGSCAAEGMQDNENALLCGESADSVAEAILRGLPCAKALGQSARDTIPLKWSRVIGEARERYAVLVERGPKRKLDMLEPIRNLLAREGE